MHGNELRRMNTKGKLDQPVFGLTDAGNLAIGGGYLFYWTSGNKLFRTLMDGRSSVEMGVSGKF